MNHFRSLCLSIAAASALFASPALAVDAGYKLEATLIGSAEVPGPGDRDGGATARVTVNPGKRQVCYMLGVSGTDTATMAHIHKGKNGMAGPVVVALTAPARGKSAGCATVGSDLAFDILKSPANYYVNVHTAAFPSGALRGQLGK